MERGPTTDGSDTGSDGVGTATLELGAASTGKPVRKDEIVSRSAASTSSPGCPSGARGAGRSTTCTASWAAPGSGSATCATSRSAAGRATRSTCAPTSGPRRRRFEELDLETLRRRRDRRLRRARPHRGRRRAWHGRPAGDAARRAAPGRRPRPDQPGAARRRCAPPRRRTSCGSCRAIFQGELIELGRHPRADPAPEPGPDARGRAPHPAPAWAPRAAPRAARCSPASPVDRDRLPDVPDPRHRRGARPDVPRGRQRAARRLARRRVPAVRRALALRHWSSASDSHDQVADCHPLVPGAPPALSRGRSRARPGAPVVSSRRTAPHSSRGPGHRPLKAEIDRFESGMRYHRLLTDAPGPRPGGVLRVPRAVRSAVLGPTPAAPEPSERPCGQCRGQVGGRPPSAVSEAPTYHPRVLRSGLRGDVGGVEAAGQRTCPSGPRTSSRDGNLRRRRSSCTVVGGLATACPGGCATARPGEGGEGVDRETGPRATRWRTARTQTAACRGRSPAGGCRRTRDVDGDAPRGGGRSSCASAIAVAPSRGRSSTTRCARSQRAATTAAWTTSSSSGRASASR